MQLGYCLVDPFALPAFCEAFHCLGKISNGTLCKGKIAFIRKPAVLKDRDNEFPPGLQEQIGALIRVIHHYYFCT